MWTREDAACILNTVTLLSVLYTFVLWFGFGVLFFFFFLLHSDTSNTGGETVDAADSETPCKLSIFN